MLWLIILLLGVTACVFYRVRRRKLYEIYAQLQVRATCYPVIGHTYLMKNSDGDGTVWFKSLGRLAIENGGVISAWIVNKLYLVVADPDTSEVILKNCMEKGYVTQFIRTMIGNGSIFAAVDIWRPRRKVLAPVFSMKNLNEFVKVFDKQSMIMADLLEPMAGGADFSVWRYFNTYTFDSVCETTLGIDLNSQKNPEHKFLIAFDFVSQELAKRMVSPWMYPEFIYQLMPRYKQFDYHRKVIHDFVDEIIKIKLQQLSTCPKGDNTDINGTEKTFLDMMIQSSDRQEKKYSDLELREELMVIVMAGTDTSAVGASFAAVMLSRHPQVQEKLHHELDDVFGNSDRALTVEDLPNLKYLEAVIKETLRLYPPVPLTAREVTNDVKLPSGITVVNGVSVVLDIWAMHHNPTFWGADTEQFQPERFLEGPLKHPLQFQPFSLPMRNCLGYNYAMMSMKTMLANMLRRYRILPPSHMNERELKEPLKVTFDVMMRHIDNYEVRLEKRIK
ncbi:cytochrome P450 4V2-like isoform X1 [Leguminivora glycinivorella]|uniref:cytochrome P450 4V2-like isoform X1 n=1 Tax=Leguminivora glycinivorella TaxID=1035111 RepID=UPI00200F8DDA|nr:cytochrome P450 4V2-like isoform X1 [Leguminivora glycinivorella]